MSWLSRIFKSQPDRGNASAGASESSAQAIDPADLSDDPVLAFLQTQVIAIAIERGRELVVSEIDIDAELYGAGYIDSLSVADLLFRAEKEYDLRLPDHIIGGNAPTLRALAKYIVDKSVAA